MCILEKFCFCRPLSFGVCYISVINLVVSIYFSLFWNESKLVKDSLIIISFDHLNEDKLSPFFYGVTVVVSVCAILGVAYSNRTLLHLLLIWDLLRFGFFLGMFPHFSKEDQYFIICIFYMAILLYCLSIECSYDQELADVNYPGNSIIMEPAASESHQFISASTAIAISEEFDAQKPYSRAYVRYLPNIPHPTTTPAPPAYSSLLPYSAGASALPTAALSTTNIQRQSVEPAYFPVNYPPPYPFKESQTCNEDPPSYSP